MRTCRLKPNSQPWLCRLKAPASIAASIDALDQRLSQRFIALDPNGYFLIKLDRDAAELVLEHFGNTIDDQGLARDSETGEVLSCKGGNAPRRRL